MSDINNPPGWPQLPPNPIATDAITGAILGLSPIHYWRLGEHDAGDTILDLGSSAVNGSWGGTPTKDEPALVDLEHGKSTTFDSGDYASFGVIEPLPRDSAWSVSLFIRGTDWDSLRGIWEFGTDDGKTFVCIGQNNSASRFSIGGNAAAGWPRLKFSPNPSVATKLLTVVYDGVDYTADTSFSLYLNTSASSRAAGSNGGAATPQDNRIGRIVTGSRDYVGGAQDCAIFNYALSPAQISSIYNAAITP